MESGGTAPAKTPRPTFQGLGGPRASPHAAGQCPKRHLSSAIREPCPGVSALPVLGLTHLKLVPVKHSTLGVSTGDLGIQGLAMWPIQSFLRSHSCPLLLCPLDRESHQGGLAANSHLPVSPWGRSNGSTAPTGRRLLVTRSKARPCWPCPTQQSQGRVKSELFRNPR